MTDPSTGRESEKFLLHLPTGLRDRLKSEAASNGRSMNAEIVSRIQRSFEISGPLTHAERLKLAELRVLEASATLDESKQILELRKAALAALKPERRPFENDSGFETDSPLGAPGNVWLGNSSES